VLAALMMERCPAGFSAGLFSVVAVQSGKGKGLPFAPRDFFATCRNLPTGFPIAIPGKILAR
jgi:hypothetical protein